MDAIWIFAGRCMKTVCDIAEIVLSVGNVSTASESQPIDVIKRFDKSINAFHVGYLPTRGINARFDLSP